MLFYHYFVCNQKHQCGFVCNNVIVSWKMLLEKIGKLLDEKEQSVCSISTCRSYIIQSGSRSKVIARTFTGLSIFFFYLVHIHSNRCRKVFQCVTVYIHLCVNVSVWECASKFYLSSVCRTIYFFFSSCVTAKSEKTPIISNHNVIKYSNLD